MLHPISWGIFAHNRKSADEMNLIDFTIDLNSFAPEMHSFFIFYKQIMM